MRKLIVSMNITLDGYMSGRDCELDWHFQSWSSEMGERLGQELSKADTILLGRTTYQAMEKYWPSKAMELLCPRDDIAFTVMMNRYRKMVYSNTLLETTWNNSIVINGDIKNAIIHLKQSERERNKNIIVYGSGKLVSALAKLKLVDEYQLWVHPVILGKGKSLFNEIKYKANLKLLDTETFNSGVVFLHFRVIQ